MQLGLNKILTIKEYMDKGLTEVEAYAMKMHDKLINKWICNNFHLPEKENEKLDALVRGLGL